MPDNTVARCQNRIYTNGWPRQCNRKAADGDALCKVCRAARKRGEAVRQANDAATRERWSMDAWRRDVATAERDVVKAAKNRYAGADDGIVALYAAVERLLHVESEMPQPPTS